MEHHRLDRDYIKESDRLKMTSFRLVGIILGGVNAVGGALLMLYLKQFHQRVEFTDQIIPLSMLVIGLLTLAISRMDIMERTKLWLYSMNYAMIPFILYGFVEEGVEPFWALPFLYVTLAFALQNRLLVINSILASLIGLAVVTVLSPLDTAKGIHTHDYLMRIILFTIFVSYVLWGLRISQKKEKLLFHYMNQAENMAYEHPLLNMPNQFDFNLYIDHTLESSELLVVKIDIKNFQSVYDVLGQKKSDALLRLVKNRLSEKMEHVAYLAKGEGGQFLAAIQMNDYDEQTDDLLKNVLEELGDTYFLGKTEYILVANMGIADSRKDGHTSSELMRNAQFALNYAKSLGMNRFAYCSKELKQSSLEKIHVSDSLYQSNIEEEFRLVYQPQLLLETGEVTGVEVLVRWHHPTMGIISPGIFIGVAEKNGFIVNLGRWIFKKSCEDIKQLNERHPQPLKLAVNVSVIEVQQQDFVEYILDVLEETGFPPELLEVELTERSFLENREEDLMKIKRLQDHGVRVAIDDFGTGYSSFEVLKRVNVDKIKIPREFIEQVDEDVANQRIVKTIISMADCFQITCLAEGIERREENDLLIRYGCQEVQGYHYSKPMPLDEIKQLLNDGKGPEKRGTESVVPPVGNRNSPTILRGEG